MPSSPASVEPSARGVPGDHVQTDGIRPGRDGRGHAIGVGHPADLHEGSAGDVGRISGRPPSRDERAHGCRRIGRPHQGLADQGAIEAERPPARDGRWIADTGLGDDDAVVGHEGAQAVGSLDVDLERPQVAIVDPDHASAGLERQLELPPIVGLDQRLQALAQGQRDELAKTPLARVQDDQEEHRIGTGGAERSRTASDRRRIPSPAPGC